MRCLRVPVAEEEVVVARRPVTRLHREDVPRRVETASVRRYGRESPQNNPHREGEEP